jgi:hypothetical protein
LNSTVIYYK